MSEQGKGKGLFEGTNRFTVEWVPKLSVVRNETGRPIVNNLVTLPSLSSSRVITDEVLDQTKHARGWNPIQVELEHVLVDVSAWMRTEYRDQFLPTATHAVWGVMALLKETNDRAFLRGPR